MLVTLITFQIDIKECFGLSKVSNKINEFITTSLYSFSKSDLKDLLLAFHYFLSNEMLPWPPVKLRIVYQRNLCRSWKSGPEQRREKNKNKLNRICWKCWNPAEVESEFFLLFSFDREKKETFCKKVKQLHVLLRQRVAKNRHNLLQKNFHSNMRFIYLKTKHNTTNFFRSQFVLIKLVSPQVPHLGIELLK